MVIRIYLNGMKCSEQVVSLQSDSGVMSHWKDFHKLAVYTYLSHEAASPFTTATGAITLVPFIPQVGVFRAGHLPNLLSHVVQLPLQVFSTLIFITFLKS